MDYKLVRLKVMEAVQDDVNKGIVKIDSSFMRQIGINPGDIIEIKGERVTAAIADRAYPGDIGLNIIRMDGNIRRNARTSIGEQVAVQKADVKPAKKVVIAPATKGVVIKISSHLFKQGLLGKALVKGDLVSLGRARRRVAYPGREIGDIFSMMEEQFAGFGLGDFKFIVVDTLPKKQITVVTPETEVEFNPQAVELKEEEGISLGINYEDVGGLTEEIKKVREMVELPLKHPEVFEKLGIEAPKGVLLHGSPGTGKTLLAKAVANETNSHFILINGPEVMSKFYGESEQNLRKKFEEAEQNAPSIIFFDEIDAIASKREEARGDVEKRVVAQLLGLMDGLKSRGKVIVIAATNMPNVLDPALRRPGRFDREIEIGVPSKEGRLEILKIHSRNMPLEGSLYLDIVASLILDEISFKVDRLSEILREKEEKLKELENRKRRADENIIFKLIEPIKDLNNEIEETRKQIASLEQLERELRGSKLKLQKLAEEIKKVSDTRSNYTLNDSRMRIIDNKLSDYYLKIKGLGLMGTIERKSRQKGLERDRAEIARITHGFVGADLSSLCKEAAIIVLRRVLPDLKLDSEEDQPIPEEILQKLMITQRDFSEALKVVRPSAMREVLVETPDVEWDDIGGLEEVKNKLKEAVEWPLKKPEIFKRMGIRPTRGILLYGPPGTGKTLLAKAVAKESEANFILINGPSLLSKWVGESEKAVREIFRKARQTAPTILFFDEIDALAPRRSIGNSDSRVGERVVNQILTEIDGLESLNDVVVIAATNRPDIVDPALLRQGRFDRIILTPVPDQASRKKIFEIYLKKMPIAKDVTVADLASETEGYVGSDIEGVCREAAMIALREDLKSNEVQKRHFKKALEVVRASVDKEVEEAYRELESYFSSARAKQIKEEKVAYVG